MANTVVLVSMGTGDMETPDDDGHFRYWAMDPTTTWECHGVSLFGGKATPSDTAKVKGKRRLGKGAVDHRPTFDSPLSQASSLRLHAEKRPRPISVPMDIEVCSVDEGKCGRKKVTPVSTVRVEVEESGVSVAAIARLVSDEAFDGQEVLLLNQKNLEVLDTSATRRKSAIKPLLTSSSQA